MYGHQNGALETYKQRENLISRALRAMCDAE